MDFLFVADTVKLPRLSLVRPDEIVVENVRQSRNLVRQMSYSVSYINNHTLLIGTQRGLVVYKVTRDPNETRRELIMPGTNVYSVRPAGRHAVAILSQSNVNPSENLVKVSSPASLGDGNALLASHPNQGTDISDLHLSVCDEIAHVAVCDIHRRCVTLYHSVYGVKNRDIGLGLLERPAGVLLLPKCVYITDTKQGRLYKHAFVDGETKSICDKLRHPTGMSLDGNGCLYIASKVGLIYVITPTGNCTDFKLCSDYGLLGISHTTVTSLLHLCHDNLFNALFVTNEYFCLIGHVSKKGVASKCMSQASGDLS